MKIGRNDLCPCGSGKKYKRCCMDNFAKQQTEMLDDIRQVMAMNVVQKGTMRAEHHQAGRPRI